VFGIGSMIYSGIEIGIFFEVGFKIKGKNYPLRKPLSMQEFQNNAKISSY